MSTEQRTFECDKDVCRCTSDKHKDNGKWAAVSYGIGLPMSGASHIWKLFLRLVGKLK